MSDIPRSAHRPPTRWRWILGLAVPARDRPGILHELDRMFEKRVEGLGRAAASRWYREEVMGFVLRVPQHGVRGFTAELGGWSMNVWRELRAVLRGLRRAPGFAALAMLTLGIGIGANALIFAIADRAVFRPLPYPDADRLVAVLEGWGTSLGSLEILQANLTTVEAIGGATDAVGMTFEPDDGPARRVSVAIASPEYIAALGVTPDFGRPFRAEEARPGQGRVALLGADFFRTTFDSSPTVVGSTLRLDGNAYTVAGVLPPGFDLPSARNDVWVPAVIDGSPANVGYQWGMGTFNLIARMKPGVTPARVLEDVQRVQEDIRLANPLWTPPSGFWDDGKVALLHDARARWARAPLFLLLAAVGVVLVVVCANVANLLLSRGLARQRDHAVRTALGAGSGRLAALQLAEVLVLACGGSVLGLGLAALGLDLIRPLLPAEVPGAMQVSLDLRVIGFTVVIAVAVALAAGALPALRVGRNAPADLLRSSGRGASSSRGRRRTVSLLVGGQMAAAVVLVSGAGLLGRSLVAMSRVDPGFQSEGRVTARLDLPPGLSEDREARAVYLQGVVEGLEQDPTLIRVALASSIPFGREYENMAVFIPGVTQDPNNLPTVQQRRVTGSFFEVGGIPLLRGRTFGPDDRLDTPLVVVVDERFAEQYFPGQDPIGQTLRYPWRGAPDIQIIGVVGATGDLDLSSSPAPTVWMPMTQFAGGLVGHAMVVALTAGDPAAALGAIETRARILDARMAASELAPYPQLLRDSMQTPRLITLLFMVFATSTLLLGCIGVYGVAAFSARERVREIGVRMTLGAHPSSIRRSMLREGLWLALPGGAVGLVLAAILGRYLRSFLYGVSPVDPVTFLATPALLVAAALAAVYLPARRATRVDPARVLREG